MSSERVLIVDDDLQLLRLYERALRGRFDVEVAESGETVLQGLAARDPYAVIVSDLTMPGMNGIELLAEVRRRSPDTVRMMMTGFADLEVAIDAINTGNTFRFLTKPCAPDVLIGSIRAGIEQYRLVRTKRVLLEQTLKGSMKVLTEILGMVNPTAFSRATDVSTYATQLARKLSVPNAWQVEMAAMLSQLGCVTIPPETLEKIYAGAVVSDAEREQFAQHPKTAADLISHLPYLGTVARMIEHQLEPARALALPERGNEVAQGAAIVHLANDFCQLVAAGAAKAEALDTLARRGAHAPELLDALAEIQDDDDRLLQSLTVDDLKPGMRTHQDVVARNGLVILVRGQEITPTVLRRLQNFSTGVGIHEPIRVLAARRAA